MVTGHWSLVNGLVTGHWSLVTGHWSLVTGHWSLVTGHWSLVTGHWSLVTGHWSLVTGHWSLVTGHWSLVTGHWSLVNGQWSWSMVNGQWSMVNGQWSTVNGQWSLLKGSWPGGQSHRSGRATADCRPPTAFPLCPQLPCSSSCHPTVPHRPQSIYACCIPQPLHRNPLIVRVSRLIRRAVVERRNPRPVHVEVRISNDSQPHVLRF